ncbi:MAG TPA: phosphoglycerate dehydrogenase [Elusimicrobiota bacterium]|jgi:D-3-phosphoglycerate dehydrogenase|nr:phosphoglycerate dehydrogenase [Elusimicrobiota bacterium]
MPENGKFTVLVTDKIDPAGLEGLRTHPRVELVMAVAPTPEKLESILPRAGAWLVRSETKITGPLLEKAKALRLIGRAGVGVDNIDVAGASRRGIAVINAPAANTISACEQTFALLLGLARSLPGADADMKAGRWERSKHMGVELAGKTLGLVGLGRIGREVAKRAQAFGMAIVAYDPFISAEQARGLGVELAELKDLLGKADFVSLHIPGSPKTRHLLNAESIAWMKKGARLINCARGELVDDAALAEALKSGHLGGAALDVFEKEPLPADSPLIGAPRLILTPHLGASTIEAQRKVAEDLSTGVIEFFERGLARHAINLPGFDADTLEALGPTLDLADKLGRFLGQTLDSGLKAVRCQFQGDFKDRQRHPLSVAALKGVLSAILEQSLSFINAPILAKERGIEFSDSAGPAPEGFTRLLTVTAVTDKGEQSVSGLVGPDGDLRIVRLDQLFVDVSPKGKMLILTNNDRPGVIGRVGTLLGRHGVNIADMRVGRRSARGEAVMVITVDEDIPPAVRGELAALDGLTSTRWVVL